MIKRIELIEEDLDNDRYIEIWNIVFSQFNSKEGLKRSEYPNFLIKILIPELDLKGLRVFYKIQKQTLKPIFSCQLLKKQKN